MRAASAAALEQLSEGDELLIVIDNNRELLDLTATDLRSKPSSATLVSVIPSENTRGLSGARNTGVAVARGELVLFLDDDAIPRPGWLASLTEPFTDPGVIGVGGVAAPAWEHEPPTWLPDEFLWVVGCSYRGLPRDSREIRNPIGANMAFRRSVVLQTGGFTDGLGRVGRTPLGCEETEFSIRAARATGGRIIQQPASVVDHLVPSDRLRLRYFIKRCWAEGISKAIVSRLIGSNMGLASERRYTTHILPAAVVAGLRDGVTGDSAGFRRAAAIVGGFLVTAAGYLRGSVSASSLPVALRARTAGAQRAEAEGRRADEQAHPAFVPIWSGQLELSAPWLPARVTDADGAPFDLARILVRAQGTPLGFMELRTQAGVVDLELAVERAQAKFANAAARADTDVGWTSEVAERVSVVVCTRNRALGLRRTLESIRALRLSSLEIIVVDNAPDDDSTRLAVSEAMTDDPRVRYVREGRRGLSSARNRGLLEATGEFIAFTDDDVTVDPLWINGLLRGFARGPEVACVTGLVATSSLAHAAEQYFDRRVWWSSSCEPRLFRSKRGPSDPPLYPYTAGIFGTGANFAARVSVLRSIGGFDLCLGAGSPTRGGEDLDMFVRLIRRGNAISYEPCALVWHEHRVDAVSLRSQMYAYGLGLTAYLTKYLLARSSRRELARRLPQALWHALGLLQRSRRAVAETALVDAGMTKVELRGMLAGPIVYARARRQADDAQLQAMAP